jgi:hypothetical protein
VKAKKEKVLMRARNACASVHIQFTPFASAFRRVALLAFVVASPDKKSETLVVRSRVSMEKSPCFFRFLP